MPNRERITTIHVTSTLEALQYAESKGDQIQISLNRKSYLEAVEQDNLIEIIVRALRCGLGAVSLPDMIEQWRERRTWLRALIS